MGRSRGGLITKIHALVDAEGRPIRLTLTADRAYDTNAIREHAAACGAWANIPPRVTRKGSFAFSRFLYRERRLAERFFNQIKQFRGIATRYDRRADNFLAAIKLAAIRIWIAAL